MSNYEIYAGLLKSFDKFDKSNGIFKIEYIFHDGQDFLNKYNIEKIIGNESTFDKVKKLLHFISNNITHKGNYDNHVETTAIELFKYAFNNSENGIKK
ncbi:hypothetical protein LJC17_05105 [Acholeplasma sp. OttesenSCG-928-E16]|nr:hypothetical protein [Acholeplasma sp. OttesenSCG-928-E16]